MSADLRRFQSTEESRTEREVVFFHPLFFLSSCPSTHPPSLLVAWILLCLSLYTFPPFSFLHLSSSVLSFSLLSSSHTSIQHIPSSAPLLPSCCLSPLTCLCLPIPFPHPVFIFTLSFISSPHISIPSFPSIPSFLFFSSYFTSNLLRWVWFGVCVCKFQPLCPPCVCVYVVRVLVCSTHLRLRTSGKDFQELFPFHSSL